MVLWDVYSEFQPGVLGTQLPKQDWHWEPSQDIDSFHLVQNRGSKMERRLVWDGDTRLDERSSMARGGSSLELTGFRTCHPQTQHLGRLNILSGRNVRNSKCGKDSLTFFHEAGQETLGKGVCPVPGGKEHLISKTRWSGEPEKTGLAQFSQFTAYSTCTCPRTFSQDSLLCKGSTKMFRCKNRNRHTESKQVSVITRFNPWIRKIPWRRKWQPTPIFLPAEFHGPESGGLQSMGVAKNRTPLSD